MAYDEGLASRLREMLQGTEGVSERKMFGGLAFLLDGHMAVAVSGRGGLMVRCDPARADEHVAQDGVARMEMRGRALRGWLLVAPDVLEPDGELRGWVDVATAYAGSLPPT